MPIAKTKYLIIGSGPTGIGAAYRLKELGITDFLVFEKEDQVGGLATSYVDKAGFTWDVGGHVQFSHYDYFDRAMEQALGESGWYHHQRESWVWMKERFIPYPFQNNIHRLPKKDCDYCLDELIKIQREQSHRPNDFKEWLMQSFGKGICELFLYPYNHKVWAYPPELMNYSWIGERVSTIDIERIKQNIQLNKDDISWGPNNTFHFPKHGGTGSIWKSLAKQIGISYFCLNQKIHSIDPNKKLAYLSDGIHLSYEKILSTMPLDKLTSTIVGCDQSLITAASSLLYSSTNIVGIGVQGQLPDHLKTKCWMYFPESNSPFYRVTVFSNYSPYNVPNHNTQYSLMTEISESGYKKTDYHKLVDQVIDGLIDTKLLSPKDQVISRWQFRTKYGYPTPSQDRDKILKKVIPKLEKQDIWSRGRFGGWKYEVSNQDHSFMQGVEWVDLVINNKPESTFKLT